MPLILPEGSQLSNRYQVTKILDVSPLRNIYLVQDLHLRGNTWVAKQILPSGSDPIGSGNVRKWIARFGSPPNTPEAAINWIESIPFVETRNYVMRALENVSVYRTLAEPETPLNIEKDLVR